MIEDKIFNAYDFLDVYANGLADIFGKKPFTSSLLKQNSFKFDDSAKKATFLMALPGVNKENLSAKIYNDSIFGSGIKITVLDNCKYDMYKGKTFAIILSPGIKTPESYTCVYASNVGTALSLNEVSISMQDGVLEVEIPYATEESGFCKNVDIK